MLVLCYSDACSYGVTYLLGVFFHIHTQNCVLIMNSWVQDLNPVTILRLTIDLSSMDLLLKK